jgi:hypothetical protein
MKESSLLPPRVSGGFFSTGVILKKNEEYFQSCAVLKKTKCDSNVEQMALSIALDSKKIL